eukprot:gene2845-4251_t
MKIKSRMIISSVNTFYVKAFRRFLPYPVVPIVIHEIEDFNSDFFNEVCLNDTIHPDVFLELGDKISQRLSLFNDV